MREKNKPFAWPRLAEDKLLDQRICDLGLRIKGTPLQDRIQQLYSELRAKNLLLNPHCWLSDEWFSPDYHPGIAIPFYLAHPRLMKLEEKFMHEVEGGTKQWCMKILRHEVGHSIDCAYGLFKRSKYQKFFGNPNRPYPKIYYPNPLSSRYVLHLGFWYAQAHPVEDFAETFAVWLDQKSNWRSQYRGWPALKKLLYVDELMKEIAGRKPPKDTQYEEAPIEKNQETLCDYYVKKQETYEIDLIWYFDKDLCKFFSNVPKNARSRTAASFLKKMAPYIRKEVAIRIEEPPYLVDQILNEMIERCKHLKLYVNRSEKEVEREAALFIAIQTFKYLNDGYPRVVV